MFRDWNSAGIRIIHDIVNDHGQLLTLHELQTKFGINGNIMQYNGLKTAIPRAWRKKINVRFDFTKDPNALMLNVCNSMKDIMKLQCKHFYLELMQLDTERPKCLEKWEELYYYANFNWKESIAVILEKEAIEQELGKEGRILIRASGTESLVRIMVETKNLNLSQKMAIESLKNLPQIPDLR